MWAYAKVKQVAATLKHEAGVYRRVLHHPRTPRRAKYLLALALGYAAMPFDLIPDWIPIIGHLDDLVIVPLLVIIALRLIPSDVIAECRQHAGTGHASNTTTPKRDPGTPRAGA